jgi:hypothetical protein
MNVMTDDDLREILGPLAAKPGVVLTFLADCCHRCACVCMGGNVAWLGGGGKAFLRTRVTVWLLCVMHVQTTSVTHRIPHPARKSTCHHLYAAVMDGKEVNN